jgi:hypothetical protein
MTVISSTSRIAEGVIWPLTERHRDVRRDWRARRRPEPACHLVPAPRAAGRRALRDPDAEDDEEEEEEEEED